MIFTKIYQQIDRIFSTKEIFYIDTPPFVKKWISNTRGLDISESKCIRPAIKDTVSYPMYFVFYDGDELIPCTSIFNDTHAYIFLIPKDINENEFDNAHRINIAYNIANYICSSMNSSIDPYLKNIYTLAPFAITVKCICNNFSFNVPAYTCFNIKQESAFYTLFNDIIENDIDILDNGAILMVDNIDEVMKSIDFLPCAHLR